MLDRVTAGEAVREIIDVLRARTNLEEALLSILARVRATLGADEAYIMLREGERLRLLAADGLRRAQGSRDALDIGEGIEGWAASRGEIVTVPDAARHPRYVDPFGRTDPVGAMAAAPLALRGRVTGIIAVARRQPGQFGGSNLWWLDVLGALAGLAIEDDRIYRAQERQARQAEALTEITVRDAAGLDGLVPRLATALSRALGVSRVDLFLLDEKQERLVSCRPDAGSPAAGGRAVASLPLAADGPLVRVLKSGQPLVCNDAERDAEVCGLFADRGVKSLLAVPVLVGGQTRGVLSTAHDKPSTFTQDDLAFVSIVAARVGSLIEAEDLRQREIQLQRVQAETKARQEFVGIVSHELKTPVAVIQAYTDLLLRRAERVGGDANADILRRIGEQADRMLNLIEQLLDLQRLEAGLFPLEISRFDVAALARRLVEETQATTQQHQLAVVATGEVVVSADRRRIEEVIQNLVDNAIKYSPEGGRIEVRVEHRKRPDGEGALVVVADHGRGIAEADQPHVFDRFYQGGNRLQRGHVGLGLGLYIAREIVRRHGGEMWLESTPNVGSAFYFSLPAAGPDEE